MKKFARYVYVTYNSDCEVIDVCESENLATRFVLKCACELDFDTDTPLLYNNSREWGWDFAHYVKYEVRNE